MKVEGFGFIVLLRKFEENSMFIKILSRGSGVVSGYIKRLKSNEYVYQIGNLVKFVWSAKNINQLGSLKVELLKSFFSTFMENKFYLYMLENITLLINNLLYERYMETKLYCEIEKIFNMILNLDEKYILMKEYLIFENTILNLLGSGIIFDKNVSIDELSFISPKTGLAVSKIKGEPYSNRLLPFPSILKNNTPEKKDVFDFISIMDFFLKKYLNENNYRQKYNTIMLSRKRLFDNI